MWSSLCDAHQDATSGGQMYWLRKLVQAKMSGNDVNAHIDELGGYTEKLNALITKNNPLTADNIHSTSLLISLLPDWLNCVSLLMNEEQVSSACIVSALKAKSLRQRTRNDDTSQIMVAKAGTSVEDKSTLSCTFCNCIGHDLSTCNNLARVIKEHKAQQKKEFDNRAPNRNSGSGSKKPAKKTSSAKTPAKAGHTSVVEIVNDLSKGDSYSENEVSGAAAACLLSRISNKKKTDFNLDSGCLVSMTPFVSTVTNPHVDLTPIRLADSTMVRSTHSGTFSIPLGVITSVKTLVVPNLHKPLLSVASLCDQGLSLCFMATACQIFQSSNLEIEGTEVGSGYH
jgi:hypothetical protein